MTTPLEPPPAAETAPAADAPASVPLSPSAPRAERFFLWVAGLGVARSDGWLGGVSAGIAARLRIDPLIVRGVLVIAALFGLPVVFLYAMAWALLPDVDGRVHARDLLRREYQPTQLGILAMAIIGLIPAAPLTGQLLGLGILNWSALALFCWIVGIVVAATLLFLIVRAARRTPGAAVSDLPMASADRAAPDASAPFDGSGAVEGADALRPGATPADASPESAPSPAVPSEDAGTRDGRPDDGGPARPVPPAPLPPGADDPASLAAWRERQAAWKQQEQAWRRMQQDAERAARTQLRRERQAVAARFSAEATERRRIRRASKPRANVAYVASAAGLALVAGAVVALTAETSISMTLGLFAAALVLATAMIIAGVARRRSGFLAFVTMLLVGAGAVTSVPAVLGEAFTLSGYGVSNVEAREVRQLFGSLDITLVPQGDGASHPIVVEKNSGYTRIDVQPGVTLQLTATVGDVSVNWHRSALAADGSSEALDGGSWSGVSGAEGTTLIRQTVTSDPLPDAETPATIAPVSVEQRSGVIDITYFELAEEPAS